MRERHRFWIASALLLAAACYSRSSERFHRRLVEHRDRAQLDLPLPEVVLEAVERLTRLLPEAYRQYCLETYAGNIMDRYILDNTKQSPALDRLRRSQQVEGVLVIGSSGQPGWNAASDYDLVIVRPQAAAWFVGVTQLDNRFRACPQCSCSHLNYRQVCPRCDALDFTIELIDAAGGLISVVKRCTYAFDGTPRPSFFTALDIFHS